MICFQIPDVGGDNYLELNFLQDFFDTERLHFGDFPKDQHKHTKRNDFHFLGYETKNKENLLRNLLRLRHGLSFNEEVSYHLYRMYQKN